MVIKNDKYEANDRFKGWFYHLYDNDDDLKYNGIQASYNFWISMKSYNI